MNDRTSRCDLWPFSVAYAKADIQSPAKAQAAIKIVRSGMHLGTDNPLVVELMPHLFDPTDQSTEFAIE